MKILLSERRASYFRLELRSTYKTWFKENAKDDMLKLGVSLSRGSSGVTRALCWEQFN